MASTNLYLDRRGKAKDGKGSIVITLSHNQSVATFPTGIRVLPSQWNGSAVVRLPGKEAVNAKLVKIKSEIDRKLATLAVEDRFQFMTATQVKAEIEGVRVKKALRHPLKDLFDEYMALGMADKTRSLYKLTYNKVHTFAGDISIEEIDYKWLLQFDKFLSETQTTNGKSVYLRCLRAVFNYALKTDVVTTYPFRMFSIQSAPTMKRSVTLELLRKLHDYPVDKLTAMYRDYFFLMFYLIGINSKDLLLAKKNQQRGDRLEYIRYKTGKSYSIKIEPEAQAIIDRHRGKGEYLLDAMDHCKHYTSFARQINEALVRIGERHTELVNTSVGLFDTPEKRVTVEPVIPGITTYYSRHSWATIAHENGIPMDTIAQALGHSSFNRTTLIYVKMDQSKVDEANRTVIDAFIGTSARV